ncbi:MAG: hypothetical protein ACM3PV_06545 [Betaproteobacteria bacterium]
MTLGHLRLRRRVSLLAAGVLEGPERDETLAHLERCARCRAEHAQLSALVREIEADPLRRAEPELPVAVMASRVERELERALVSPRGKPRWWLVALPVAAATLTAAVLVPRLVERFRPSALPVRAAIPPLEAPPLVAADTLARIERNVAREHAARYLNEASALLVSVSATGLDCDRRDDRLDVGEAPERSRQLLERRQLVLESGGQAVASAQGVLDDVEQALREVAELPSCVRRRDVERVRAQVERRQLLMRIRLMTRELEG